MKYTENPLLHKKYEYDDDLNTCILDDFYENHRNNSSDTNTTYVSNSIFNSNLNENKKKKDYFSLSYYLCCFT